MKIIVHLLPILLLLLPLSIPSASSTSTSNSNSDPDSSTAATAASPPTSAFVPPQYGDSIEFQTILQAWPNSVINTLCPQVAQPSFQAPLVNDAVDPTSFFLLCQSVLLRVTTNAVGNETNIYDKVTRLATGVAVLQLTPPTSTAACAAMAQVTNGDGTILLALQASDTNDDELNSLGLYDRLGVREPQFLWTSPTRTAVSIVTFTHDATAVYWVLQTADPYYEYTVMFTRLNYSHPNSSVEFVLPFSDSILLSITGHPRLPLLYVYLASTSELIEYNIVANTSRLLMDFGSTYINSTLAEVAFTDTDDIILASLRYLYYPTNAPFVTRIHRDSLAFDTILTAEDCGGGVMGASFVTYSARQQLLFIACLRGDLLVGSFNGSIADPSTAAEFHTVSDSTLTVAGVLLLPSDTNLRLIIYNFQGTSIAPWSIIATSGMSLTPTMNQLECSLPILVSAQRDELGRQVLLHNCGLQQIPAVSVNGEFSLLSNLCRSFDTLLHRAGTSEVFARCTTSYPNFVASVHTDNSQPRIVFVCPNEPQPSQNKQTGSPPTMADTITIAQSNSLLIMCEQSVWLLPLDESPAGSPRMLMNVSDPTVVGNIPVSYINGLQVSSMIAFVSVQYVGGSLGESNWMAVIASQMNQPKQHWRQPAFDWSLGENSTSAFYDLQLNEAGSLTSFYFRRDIHADGTPGQSYTLFNCSFQNLLSWQLDSWSRQLIIALADSSIWLVDAYAQVNYPAARAIFLPAGCFDTTSGDVYVASYPRLNLFLVSCPLFVGADWTLTGLALEVLRNASAPVVWNPFLRGTAACPQVGGVPTDSSDSGELFLQCAASQVLTMGFQCAPGQQWSLGQCRNCLPGSSKALWNSSTAYSANTISQCTSCPSGSIAVSPAAFTCTLCPAGTFHDVTLGEVCRPCPAGRYANASGMIDCPSCPSGFVQPSLASSSCTPCPLGSLADSNAVTCIPCVRGSYTPLAGANATCISCEGAHQSGLNCTYGMASVQEGYFAFQVEENGIPVYQTAECAFGCPGSPLQLPAGVSMGDSSTAGLWSNCPVPDDGTTVSTIQYCCWPRLNSATNLMCAQCSDGYIPWSSTCVKCNGPNGLLISGLLIFALALVTWLFSNTRAQVPKGQATSASRPSPAVLESGTTGHVALLLYFVQISSVQLGRSSDWLQWLHLSNLSAQSTRGCIAPLDPYQQTALNLAVPIMLSVVLFVVGCTHLCLDCCCRRNSKDAEIDAISEDSELNLRVSLDNSLTGRLAEARDKRQPLMQAQGDMYGGNERAYSPPPQSSQVAAPESEPRLSPVIQSLYGCYQQSAWFWNSTVLLRRMLFAVVAVFLSSNMITRNALFVLLHFGSLILHQLALPYKLPALNRAEVITSSILLLQAVFLLMQQSPPPYTTWFEICMSLLVILPVLVLLLWMLYIKVGKNATKSDQTLCKRLCARFSSLLSPPSFSLGRYYATVVAILLFCYTSVTSTVFTFLRCIDLSDGVSLVFQEPTMDCESDRYKLYRVWVLVVLGVYVIGFPLVSLALLAWKRGQIKEDGTKSIAIASNF